MNAREIVDRPQVTRMCTVDMLKVLTDLESYFTYQMKASNEVYETFDEFTTETYDDLQLIKAQIRILKTVHLIDDDEYGKLITVFEDIRDNYISLRAAKPEEKKTEDNDNGN